MVDNKRNAIDWYGFWLCIHPSMIYQNSGVHISCLLYRPRFNLANGAFQMFRLHKCIRFAQQLVQYGGRVRYSGLSFFFFCALDEFSVRIAIN